MASTERSEDQVPASTPGETPSLPPDESTTPSLEPLAVAGGDALPNGEHENGHGPADEVIVPVEPALPVRRARRVVLADLLPPPPVAAETLPLDAVAPNGVPNGSGDGDGHLEAPATEIIAPVQVEDSDGMVAAHEPLAPVEPVNGGVVEDAAAAPLPLVLPDNGVADSAPAIPPSVPPTRPAVTAWTPSAAPVRRGRRNGQDERRTPAPPPVTSAVAGATAGSAVIVAAAPPLDAPAAPARKARVRVAPPVALPPAKPDPDDLEALAADATPAPATGWRAALASSALWRSRALLLGGLGLGLALYGQKIVVDSRDIIPSIRWYAAGILLMIVAWLGTYKNKSFVLLPFRRPSASSLPMRMPAREQPRRRRFALPAMRELTARQGLVLMAFRYVLAFGALGLNLYSVQQLRTHGFDSAVGGWGWLVSLVLLLIAFIGHRPKPHRSADALITDVEDKTDPLIPRWLEITIVVLIVLLGFGLRVYRLDDWTTGMHGDEGEAGVDALGILEGDPVSPFLTGWFSQPNFYYWGIALTMKVFGTGMLGLRMFSTLAGSLMLIPFYPMVRQWFGIRTAMIATFLLAISDVAIHFSRQEFSNITTPLFLVTGFYFFFRGLKDRRLLNFVLAGYAHILSMYFYLGGRLTPILVIAFLVYLFLLMPLVRVPGAYSQFRKLVPDLSRLGALGRAVRLQARSVWLYAGQLIVYGLACICFVSPWLAYFLDHQAEWNSRANEKLILNNPDRMVQQHGATHTPLYVGIRMPTGTDILPLPIVFEQTPVSIRLLPLPWDNGTPKPGTQVNQLLQDGFWARAMWGQLTTTLSILTYRGDASSVYTFTGEPVAKPIEAVLIILGIAWAAWRWRDTRMALLTLWFWSTVFVGGVLTIDAPYMARIVGVIPTLAIFAALPLSKLIAAFINVIGRFGRSIRLTQVGTAVSGVAVFALLAFLARENYTDYYDRYVETVPAPFAEVTGQAYFVRQVNQQLAAEGRPTAKFYDLGAHLIYWGHGDNRFLNHGVEGLDMVNSSNELPVTENGDHDEKDVVFMVWGLNQQYLSVLKAYYPGGIEQPFVYPDPSHGSFLFTSYRVTKEQLDAQRVMLATYTPANGPAIQRYEPSLGTSQPPPADLSYPLGAAWTGSVVAPAFGRYHFQLDGPSDSRLVIDGTPVLTMTTKGGPVEGDIILARGPHDVALSGTLAAADTQVSLKWSVGGQAIAPVPRRFLWKGPGRGLLGEIRPAVGDPWGPLAPDNGNGGASPTLQRRIDGFLGFRDAPNALSNGAPLIGDWTGTLNVDQAGAYQFSVFSNGDSIIKIDDQLVVDNRQGTFQAHEGNGSVTLTPGPHQIDIRYTWMGNVGYFEVYWTPPGGQKTMLGPANLQASGGLWQPGSITEPGNVNVQLGAPPPVVPADSILDARDTLQQPRGLALDAKGNIYVADSGHHQVVVLDPNGKPIATWGKQGKGPGEFATPEDIAIGADGQVYVIDSELGHVSVFGADGKFVRSFGDGALCSPAGITMGPDGMIYVASVCNSRIYKFSPAGEDKGEYTGGSNPGTQLSQPVDVSVGPDGMLYVADLRNRVVRINPATDTIEKTWSLQIGTNLGAANIALFGKLLYVTDPDRNHVDVINVETGRIDQYGQGGTNSGQFGEPLGIAVSADGRVYVMDSDHGRIEVFNKLVPK